MTNSRRVVLVPDSSWQAGQYCHQAVHEDFQAETKTRSQAQTHETKASGS